MVRHKRNREVNRKTKRRNRKELNKVLENLILK